MAGGFFDARASMNTNIGMAHQGAESALKNERTIDALLRKAHHFFITITN